MNCIGSVGTKSCALNAKWMSDACRCVELRPVANQAQDTSVPGLPSTLTGDRPSRENLQERWNFDTVLDLHPKVLARILKCSPSEVRLRDAIRVARHFIQQAIKRRKEYLRIIHGKGEGKLREALFQMCEGEFGHAIQRIEPLPDGGSLVVWLKG